MSFDESRKKAFDFCADATKQLITLSTAIIAFTVTFGKDFLGTVPDNSRIFAYLAWGAHVLSIIFGLVVLLALTAQLQPKKTPAGESMPSIRGAPATYSGLQILCFLVAMALTAYFGFKAAGSQAQTSPPTVTLPSLQLRVEALERLGTKIQGDLVIEAIERVGSDTKTEAQLRQLSLQISSLRRKVDPPCGQQSSSPPSCCHSSCGR